MNSQEIVKIIETELKRQGIPKSKFYEDVGIKSGHMSNWRLGNNDPSVKTLVKISEYLGLDLLGTKTPPAEDGEGRDDKAIANREELLRKVWTLSPAMTEAVLRFLDIPEEDQESAARDLEIVNQVRRNAK